MVTTKKTKIGGHEVSVLQFAGSEANKMLVKFSQSIDKRTETIIASPDDWQVFCFDFLRGTTVDNREVSRPEVFDDTFAGGVMSFLFPVIMFVAEVNFGTDFLLQGGPTGTIQGSPIKTAQKSTPK